MGLYWSQWPLLPWLLKNFFIPRCSIKLSLDLLLGYQQEEHLYLLNRQRNGHFCVVSFPVAQLVEHGASNAKIMGSIPRESKRWQNVETVTWMQCKSLWIKASAKCINVNVNVKKRCAHSKQLCLILCWLCWFKSSWSVVPHVASSMKQAVTIFSGQSVISRVYMSCFVNGTVHLEPQPRCYWKMYQVLYPVEPPKSEPYRTMQWKSDICGSTLIEFFYSCLQRNQMTLFKNVFSSVSFFEAHSHTCNFLFSVKYHFKQFCLYRSFVYLCSHAFERPVMILLFIFQGMWWTFRRVNGWESRAVSVQVWTRSMSTSSSPTSCLGRKKTTGCSLQLMQAFRATWEEGDYKRVYAWPQLFAAAVWASKGICMW